MLPSTHTLCDLCNSKFEVATFKIRCIYKKIHWVTQNDAQYPPHHMSHSYAPTKFEVTMPKGLGGDAFTS